MSHGEQLARNARRIPDRVAFEYLDRAATYRQLDAQVNRLARGLQTLGVERGDRVAVLMLNRLELIETYFAVLKLGAIVVPVNFRLSVPEIVYVLEDSDAKVLFADHLLAPMAAQATGSRTLVISGGDHEGIDQAIGYDTLLETDDSDLGIDVDENEPAFIMYTSGTTGKPKGAVLTHMNLLMNTINVCLEQGVSGDGEVGLSGLPLFHIGGLSGMLAYVFVGGTSILIDVLNFDPARALEVMSKRRVVAGYFVPTQWKAICEAALEKKLDYSLERIAWGASAAPPSVLQAMSDAFGDVPVYNVFGQTEMSSATCILRGEDALRKNGSVGKPLMNVEARLVDADMNDVPIGEVGEIVYRGPTVMKEYWRNPDATADAMRGGWFHSGDLCVMDDEGYIKVVDRTKDMVNSGGENIYCAEVEDAIDAHSKVAEVAVVARPHPRWVETPVAVIVPTDPADPPTLQEIADHCKSLIASYKKPTEILVVDALPRNAVGKVQKFKLREQLAQQ
jgi:acyl-CoA synthetase (AMP-forming)/AMP-acid ligase II